MSKLGLINRVKYNRRLYNLYFTFGSILIKLIKLFVSPNDYLIVFVSYGGRKFDDSPKSIYDAMTLDNRFDNYQLVWAFISPDAFEIPRGKKVKTDTLNYYITLLKARCWVTNSSVERGLSFCGKKTFYLNTWHGTAMKKMGTDINTSSSSFKTKAKSSNVDIVLAQGQYDVDLFSRVFGIPESNFRITGLPRNDGLVLNNTPDIKSSLRKYFDIPDGKKVVLYAPTFREYTKDSSNNVVQSVPLSFERLKRDLGNDYVFLLRAHYEVLKVLDIREDTFLRNVSSYPDINDLMLVSDLLISDYSSIFFDYSIMEKPMLCYAYDYDEYQEKRGLYFDVRKALHSNITDEEALIEELRKVIAQPDVYRQRTVRFRSGFVTEFGDASHKSLDIIYESIK